MRCLATLSVQLASSVGITKWTDDLEDEMKAAGSRGLQAACSRGDWAMGAQVKYIS